MWARVSISALALVLLCSACAVNANALFANAEPQPPPVGKNPEPQPPPIGKGEPQPPPVGKGEPQPPPVGKSDPPIIPPPVSSSQNPQPMPPPPISDKPKRYVTAVISSHPATVVSTSDLQDLQSATAASSQPQAGSTIRSSFRSLRRMDPVVRKNSCPQGCLPAPRTSRDDHSSESKASNDRGNGGAGSLANSLSPSTDKEMAHDKADSAQSSQETNAHPTLPHCPSGCMMAPDL